MVQARPKKRKPPYKIPPVTCPSDQDLQRLDSWRTLEFFRIEALLRSERIWALWKRARGSVVELAKKFRSGEGTLQELLQKDRLMSEYHVFFGWNAIFGYHHQWLSPDYGPPPERYYGISHVKDLLNHPSTPITTEAFRRIVEGSEPRFMWLAIETIFPPNTILRWLRKELTARHRQNVAANRRPSVSVWKDHLYADSPHDPRRKAPIRDVRTWLDYFKCYDLRHAEGLEYGPIAERVYGTKDRARERAKQRDRAETAVARAQQLIEAAETNNWPPPKIA